MLLEKEEFKTPQVRKRGHLTTEERKQLNYLKRKEKVTPLDKAERYELMELEHKAHLHESNQIEQCVICGDDIQGYGNNAEPVAEGKCCDNCNLTVVIPERLKALGIKDSLTEGKNLDDIVYDALSRITLKGDDGKPRHPEVYANPKGNGYRLEIEDDESGIDQVASIAKKYKLNYNIKHMRDYTEITVDLPERKLFEKSYKRLPTYGNDDADPHYVVGDMEMFEPPYFDSKEEAIREGIKRLNYYKKNSIDDELFVLYSVWKEYGEEDWEQLGTYDINGNEVPYDEDIYDEEGILVPEGKNLEESFELDTNEYDKIRNSKINPRQDLHTIYHVNTLEDAWDFMQYGFKHGFDAWYAVFTQGSDGSFVRDFRAGPDEDYLDNAIEFCKNYSEPVRLEYIVADPTGKEIAYINIFENTNLDESYKVVDKDGNKVPQGGGFTSKKEAEMFAAQYGEKDLKVIKESFECRYTKKEIDKIKETLSRLEKELADVNGKIERIGTENSAMGRVYLKQKASIEERISNCKEAIDEYNSCVNVTESFEDNTNSNFRYVITYKSNGREWFWNGALDINNAEIFYSKKQAKAELDKLIKEHQEAIIDYKNKLNNYKKSEPSLYTDFIDEYQEFIDTAKIVQVNISINILNSNKAEVYESFEDEHLGTVESTPEPGPEAGIASLINKLIVDEWEAIQGYNDAIVAAETEGYSDIAQVLRDIANEENLHVGQLEQCMKTISPNAESINQGEIEAEGQLNTTTETSEDPEEGMHY